MISNKIAVKYLIDVDGWKAGEYRRVSPELAEMLVATGRARVVGVSPVNKMVKE